LDFAVEQEDVGHSNVIAATANQTVDDDEVCQKGGSTYKISHSSITFPSYEFNKRMGPSPSSKLSNYNSFRSPGFSTGSASILPVSYSTGHRDISANSIPAQESDVFFPLQMSPEDSKEGIVISTLQTDSEMTQPVPVSQPIPSEHLIKTTGEQDSAGMNTLQMESHFDNKRVRF
jgi:hypothetical protein